MNFFKKKQKIKLKSREEVEAESDKLTEKIVKTIETHCNMFELCDNDMNVMVLQSINKLLINNFSELKKQGLLEVNFEERHNSNKRLDYVG